MKIDVKYKIPLIGEYNASISHCPECGNDTDNFKENYNVVDFAIGIADSDMGEMIVIECPFCFHKFYFHTRRNREYGGFYSAMLRSIHFGCNKHFQK